MRTHVLESRPDDTRAASFRAFLQAELARRCARNARYSLRAFANFLDMDHATLSQMLRGKRAISAASMRRLGARLGLSAGDIDRYVAIEQSLAKTIAQQGASRELAQDALSLLGQWYPAAILELMRLKEFRPDARWIARMLSIEIDEVQLALHQLTRLGFLRMTSATQWDDLTGGNLHGEEEFTLHAIEALAARSRALQLDSARQGGMAPRHHSSSTVAVRRDQAAALIARASSFLAELAASVDQQPADVLYRVELHCFPLTATPSQDDDHGQSRNAIPDRDPRA